MNVRRRAIPRGAPAVVGSATLAAWTALVLATTTPSCSDPLAPPEPPAPDATEPGCPASLAASSGAACSAIDLVCTELFTCGAFRQQETCRCVDGHFACRDQTGAIAIGAPPRCVGYAAPDDDPCPARMADAIDRPCDVIGRACFFHGTICEDGIERTDYCTCVRDETRGARVLECHVVTCPPPPERRRAARRIAIAAHAPFGPRTTMLTATPASVSTIPA